MRQAGTTSWFIAGTAGGSPTHAAQIPISPPQGAGTNATAGASRQASQRWPGMGLSLLKRCASGSKAAMVRWPLTSCRRLGSLLDSLMLSRPLGLPAVLVVSDLRLKRIHLRLHVEDVRFEFSEALNQIHRTL